MVGGASNASPPQGNYRPSTRRMADSGAPGANGTAGGMGPTRGHTAPAPGGNLTHGRPVHPGVAPPPHSSIPKPASNALIATGVVCGPRIVILHRYNGDFGFTLRHFIVYPPDSLTEPTINPLTTAGVLNFAQPMDTVFVKKVHANTPAHMAGLQEGDRLLAVNGVPVTSIPYSQVVATIQQTPKTLTLQVVPKNYDILQTFFSETAHNPETNQRPQPQQPYAPKAITMAAGAYPKSKPAPPHPLTVEGVQEKQESLYSTLQEIVADNVGAPQPATKNHALHAEVPKMLTHAAVPLVHHMAPHLQKPMVPIAPKPISMPYEQQQHYMQLHQQQQQFLQKMSLHGKDGAESLSVTGDGGYAPLGEGDSAIMSRLRKSLEQKEEFLRRPLTTMQGALVPMGTAQPPINGLPSAHDVQQREFYARPNRLQKSVWPPSQTQLNTSTPGTALVSYGLPAEPNKSTSGLVSPPSLAGTVPTTNVSPTTPPSSQTVTVATSTITKPMVSSTNMLREHASQLSAIREHFFTSGIGGSLQLPPKSAPPSLAIAPVAVTTTAGPSSPTGAATVPLSPHSMHAVSEKAKLFESGRPLSPEGIDRMDLYKSELSRINTKQVVPNVAVRRKEFELKAESTGWRKSIEDKPRSVSSDSESRRTPVRLRSLSVESNATRDSRHSLASSSLLTADTFDAAEKERENQQHPVPPVAMLRQKPIRDDSYRNAVRNSTAFWLQGPLPTASESASVHGPSALAESSSTYSVGSDSDTACTVPPIPPVRTYAAAHRLHHPLSAADTEQMRMKMLHRNQTIVELRHFLAGDGDGGIDGAIGGDIEMFQRPPLTSPPLAPLSPLTVASSVTSTSSVPLTHLVTLEHATGHGSAGPVTSGIAAPPSTPTSSSTFFRPGSGPIRPTTLNLCTDGSVPAVVMRQKQPHHPLLLEDDERKMRRISYLRATAHDNLFHMLESDADSSPMSLPSADTPDTDATEPPVIESPGLPTTVSHGASEDSATASGKMQPQQLKSAYRPWRRPRLTTDIQPLRRLFDPVSSDSTTSSPLPPIPETEHTPGTSAPSTEPSSKKRSRPRPIPRPPNHQDDHDVDVDDDDNDDDDYDDVDVDHLDDDDRRASSRPGPTPARSTIGKGRSASLVTTTPLGSGTGGRLFGAASSLGNLHVITTTTAGGVVTRNYFFAQSHGTKSKALAHFRDGAADTTEPLVRGGELHVKVTLIDGKRSADRSWRTVHAELRGHHLKLTLVREGKNSNQSPEPCGTIDLTNFHVTEGNYTKRKNVFKLTTAVGSYCPLEAAAVAGFGHAEVHRTQSASGLANVGGAGSTCGSSIRSASTVGLPGSERELLLQADSHSDMQQWMESLRLVCGGGSTNQLHSPDYLSGRGGQQAEPQRIAAQTSVQVHAGSVSGGANSGDDYSPVLPAKSQRKYALGSRSPSGQSPVTKSRKTPQTGCSSPTGSADQPIVSVSVTSNQPTGQYHQPHHQPQHLTLQQQQQQFAGTKDSSDRESGSPKSKTWKGIVARQFRKMQGQPPGSPGASATGGSDLLALPDGASINVPLQQCPVSEENPYVPLVLTKCTGIVESKGMGVVGIYRIPGNTAAITQLTETINRGLDEATLRDPRWEDVNVVSSLLKSFIRNLPEPLLPNELYGGFIAADKMTGQRRLLELRQLLRRVPPMNYETLKHLMRHLHRVSTHNEVNLMDPRNLAIVFGPSVVRSANESLETAVKDMRHQCQIVEVLINYYQYFFEDGLLPSVDESKNGTGTVVDSGLEVPSTSLLLDNVAKIEPFKEQSKESTSGFVANIVQAANRKIRRTAQRKSTMSSTTPDTLSLDSTTSAESKEQSSRVIRRYLELGPKPGTAMSVGAGSGGSERALQVVHDVTGPGTIRGPRSVGSAGPGCEPPTDDSLLQLHHHHHHHHHYYHSSSSRHHSSQSNDDASSVLNRSSEDDSNDSAFADNGSMSLKTVTIALDNKLRSLRDSSIDSDRDQTQESDGDLSGGYGNGRHSLHQQWSHMGRSPRPLTLGENIPYADESPERPLIQGRAKPQRSLTIAANNNNNNQEDSVPTAVVTPGKQQLKKALTAHSQKSIDSGSTVNSSTNNSCLTLVNEADATLDGSGGGGGGGNADVGGEEQEGETDGQQQPVAAKGRNVSLSSDETDTSTTSNPREKLTAATYRIDTEKLKKMNRILTQLERKANNLERKFNLNRSLSLNYKSPKGGDCCCSHHGLPMTHSSQAPLAAHCCQHQQQQQQHISNNLNNNNSTSCHNHNGGGGVGGTIVSLRSRFSLTKDEKTDKNINRRRQIHDTSVTPQPAGTASAPATSGGGGSSCTVTGNGNASGSNDSSSCGEPCGPQIILTPATVTPNASTRQRRHVGSRSIRRRHTVGGTHDYYSNKMNGQHHHHHHHHHPHHQPHHNHVGPGCCPVPQN
ncbi:uncharacterized protein LOC125760522 isoform X1 [Anopheles funestus]|uniref:uncharacterized protein LOC125760522 isoform X1 n=1 Tax=Anopheles funestus TaxID=62324 RepID=UPI0020C6F09E|nr:uncharacterized protein LOC125760522 isoform X1 [Anopheles funestus]XP_049276685.1 uncharacterized protein LOC125760522 isoform X1 [Anopheles funestus]XP_049276692.1 uncharacterized protein LOC125760522 isoform X1 [Anopheles funestus]XP_049276701.1 uncharacterized protein LOC125760522 isoform X1 [Anopheles funestus]